MSFIFRISLLPCRFKQTVCAMVSASSITAHPLPVTTPWLPHCYPIGSPLLVEYSFLSMPLGKVCHCQLEPAPQKMCLCSKLLEAPFYSAEVRHHPSNLSPPTLPFFFIYTKKPWNPQTKCIPITQNTKHKLFQIYLRLHLPSSSPRGFFMPELNNWN